MSGITPCPSKPQKLGPEVRTATFGRVARRIRGGAGRAIDAAAEYTIDAAAGRAIGMDTDTDRIEKPRRPGPVSLFNSRACSFERTRLRIWARSRSEIGPVAFALATS